MVSSLFRIVDEPVATPPPARLPPQPPQLLPPLRSGIGRMLAACKAPPSSKPGWLWIRTPKCATTSLVSYLKPLAQRRGMVGPAGGGHTMFGGFDRAYCNCTDDDGAAHPYIGAGAGEDCEVNEHGALDYFPGVLQHVGYRRCIHRRLRRSGRGEPVVIFNIRSPLDRLFSAYSHGFQYGATKRCASSSQKGCGVHAYMSKAEMQTLPLAAKLAAYAQHCQFGGDNIMVQLWDPIAGDPGTALSNFRAAAPNMIVINADSEEGTDRGHHQLRAALCDPARRTEHAVRKNVGSYAKNASALLAMRREAAHQQPVQQAIAGDLLIFAEALQLLEDQDAEYTRFVGS